MWYRLVGKIPIECTLEDLVKEQETVAGTTTHIGNDKFKVLDNDVLVSTVFLPINHNYGDGPPLLFETMVFGGDYDGYQLRYHNYDEAFEGHQKIINMVKGLIDEDEV